MTDTTAPSGGATSAAAAAGLLERHHWIRHALFWIPWFVYFMILYVIMELTVHNVRDIVFTNGAYALSWIEVMYLIATFIAMAELLRVSKPGIDNTYEAVSMLVIWIVYLVFFILGANGIRFFHIFSNTEFLMFTLISFAQVILAFIVNARTLKRTLDMGANS